MSTPTQSQPPDRSPARRRGWVRIVAIVALVLVLLCAGTGVALTLVANGFARSDQIAKNVFIETVPVAGMTTTQAAEAVRQQWVAQLPQEIKLTYPGGSVEVPVGSLGTTLELDQAAAEAYRVGRLGSVFQQVSAHVQLLRKPAHVAVGCTVDEVSLDASLAGIAQQIDRKPKNAKVDVSGDDSISVTPEVNGVALDVAHSKAALLTALKTPSATEVALVVNEEKPSVTKADLADLETVLGSYTTQFNSGQEGRTRNLTLAAQTLDRTLIKPGDTFSLNGIVGERTPQRGFRKAPIFGEGGTLLDDYGGGVCQVSSTTYNAALLANMQIVERTPHVRTVTYVPLGRDAMVSYGGVDLKWRNTLAHPVLLLARVDGESLTVSIIGKRSDKREVRIERSGVGGVGRGQKEVPDPDLAEGKHELEKSGWDGGRASVQRQVKVGDRWETNFDYTDYYSSQPDIIRVGTKKKPKTPTTPSVPGVPGVEPTGPQGPDGKPTDVRSGPDGSGQAATDTKPKPKPKPVHGGKTGGSKPPSPDARQP